MDSEACYDVSGDGEHCICGYNPPNGDIGCCTGTLQIDMGGGITGNFDYIGWDAEYNKPYYRTKACLRIEPLLANFHETVGNSSKLKFRKKWMSFPEFANKG